MSLRLQEVFFALENVATFEIFFFHVIDRVEFLLTETEGLGHHAATDVRHGIKIDFYAERIDEIRETSSIFGSHEFTLFEQVHFFVYFFY